MESALELIGNTPLVRVNRLAPPGGAEIWAKLEGFNPGGSVKDRVALSMIEAAEKDGKLAPGQTIIEPTSGNTGIGLALVGGLTGYKVVLVMPESASIERRQILKAFCAGLVLTPAQEGMLGAIDKAEALLKENPGWFMPLQFENPANPEAHRRWTAPEIISQMGGVPDALVAGVGTGGTITGVGEMFKNIRKDVLIVAVEPAYSAVLSGGEPGKHRIAGIGAGFYPGVLNTKIYDEIIPVRDEDAEVVSRELARQEGMLCGISSGAAMWAAIELSKRLGEGKRIAVILPDRGERYFSTGLFPA
ncbi:MAG: cysteine synthase A [Nitrospiraceae bacterium]|nr:cysteine synthase A [Nitrospiraceae bacterium]